jgi:glycosyltransferase involved in cell wall biosynthesis
LSLVDPDSVSGLVSVIMPSFNHEAFVVESLRSVFDQSYRKIELLIVDDCSTDATFGIIKKTVADQRFSGRFSRVRVIRNERNLGTPFSLNIGLAQAHGEFITFINSDDFYQPHRLRLMTASCHVSDEPFVAFSGVQLVDKSGNSVRHHELKEILELGPARLRAVLPSMSFGFLRYQLTGSTGNIFVNRLLLNEIGGFCTLKYCHDWEFMLRTITVVEPSYIPDTAYKYRIHDGNTFGRLQHLAADDSTAALGSYYRRIVSSRVRNRTAPTPTNWPYVFEMIARQFAVYDLWLREANCVPRYALRARTGGADPALETPMMTSAAPQ